MARRLPNNPSKRRVQYFKRIFQHLEHWHALMEDRGMSDVITTPEGEDIFLGDLMRGLPLLPQRQREAFELICLKGFTETAARDVLSPASKSSTPIQQAADSGLARMVAAYDSYQAGIWPPPLPLPAKSKRRSLMTVLHPLVRRGLEQTRKEILTQLESHQQALAQVDALLQQHQAPTQPAPNPRPEGRDLKEMARELASAG